MEQPWLFNQWIWSKIECRLIKILLCKFSNLKPPIDINFILIRGKCVTGIIKNDGILKMWTGLGAGILRQCSYTTVRLGVYRKLEEKYYPKTFGEKLALG